MNCLKPTSHINETRSLIVLCKRFNDQQRAEKLSYGKKRLEISPSLSTKKSMIMEPTSKMMDSSTPLLLTSGASGRVNALVSLRTLKSLMKLITALVLFLLGPFSDRKLSSPSTEPTEKSKKSKKHGISIHRKASNLRVPAAMVSRRSDLVVTVDQDILWRRALAIERATQDDDANSVREVSMFVTSRGDTLFTQSWTPGSVKIKGLVVILHGLNEHSGRYSDFAKQLNVNGYKVFGMDWIGHGGSDGLHGYVHSLDDAVKDMQAYLEKVLAENPGLPCFCFGHSTGAAIILKAILNPEIEARVEGIVLTSPAIRVQPSHPIFGVLAPIFAFFLPKYQFSAANKKGMPVSRDPEAVAAKYSDPLVYTGSIRIRTGSEILGITSYLQQNLCRLRIPFLVLHGAADTVTDPEASQKLYEEASSSDKSIKLYDGLLHDLLFEFEREAIIEDIMEWLNSRIKD